MNDQVLDKSKLNLKIIREKFTEGDMLGLEEIQKQFIDQGLDYFSSNEYELLIHTIYLNCLAIGDTVEMENKKIYSDAEILYIELKEELFKKIGLYELENRN